MRPLAGLGEEEVIDSDADSGFKEGRGEEAVSSCGGRGEERDVIGEEGRREGAKVCEDLSVVK